MYEGTERRRLKCRSALCKQGTDGSGKDVSRASGCHSAVSGTVDNRVLSVGDCGIMILKQANNSVLAGKALTVPRDIVKQRFDRDSRQPRHLRRMRGEDRAAWDPCFQLCVVSDNIQSVGVYDRRDFRTFKYTPYDRTGGIRVAETYAENYCVGA